MTIYDFKPGDIIHRLGPGKYGDRSFMENPIELVEVTSGLIFYKWADADLDGTVNNAIRRVATELFLDDEWDFFPEKYLKKPEEKEEETEEEIDEEIEE